MSKVAGQLQDQMRKGGSQDTGSKAPVVNNPHSFGGGGGGSMVSSSEAALKTASKRPSSQQHQQEIGMPSSGAPKKSRISRSGGGGPSLSRHNEEVDDFTLDDDEQHEDSGTSGRDSTCLAEDGIGGGLLRSRHVLADGDDSDGSPRPSGANGEIRIGTALSVTQTPSSW